jgi:hypothetical protein
VRLLRKVCDDGADGDVHGARPRERQRPSHHVGGTEQTLGAALCDDRRARHGERLSAVAGQRRELEDVREPGLDVSDRKRHPPVLDREELLRCVKAGNGRELRGFDAQ